MAEAKISRKNSSSSVRTSSGEEEGKTADDEDESDDEDDDGDSREGTAPLSQPSCWEGDMTGEEDVVCDGGDDDDEAHGESRSSSGVDRCASARSTS